LVLAWSATVGYPGGSEVQYGGIKYLANWYTTNERPDLNYGVAGSGKPWTNLGACGSARMGIADMAGMLEVYPNPAQNVVNVNVQSQADGNIEIMVSDMISNTILVKQLNAASGNNNFQLDVSSLESGIYILSISNGNDKLVKQLVINK
jgi:hypothetical protein